MTTMTQFLAVRGAPAGGGKAPVDHIAQVILAIVCVVVLVRILGVLCRRIRQPPVIGEVLAGILLGTSLLGQFHSGDKPWTEVLFPLDVRPFLTVLANLGLIIFMFVVGLELDTAVIRGNERKAAVISLSSVAVPFAGGAALGLALYGAHQKGMLGHSVDRLAFVLFLGASMCVTAFPVLARILTDRGMHRTPLGVIVLACAAIDDVLAWTLLAVVSAVAGVSGDPLWEVVTFSVIYVAGMFLLVRPVMGRFITRAYRKAGRLTPDILALLIVGLLMSAWITDRIGIHFIFGAFVFGVCVPREGTAGLRQEILSRLEQLSVLVLLPMFFIISGLAVDLTTLSGHYILELLLVLLIAVGGKFLGAAGAARFQGIPRRRARC